MDIITTAILAALAHLAVPVVNDSYAALKTMIARKFGESSDVAQAIEKLEQKPASKARAAALAEEVAGTQVEKDEETSKAAMSLLETIKQHPNGARTINDIVQNVTGNRNIFSGTGDVKIIK